MNPWNNDKKKKWRLQRRGRAVRVAGVPTAFFGVRKCDPVSRRPFPAYPKDKKRQWVKVFQRTKFTHFACRATLPCSFQRFAAGLKTRVNSLYFLAYLIFAFSSIIYLCSFICYLLSFSLSCPKNNGLIFCRCRFCSTASATNAFYISVNAFLCHATINLLCCPRFNVHFSDRNGIFTNFQRECVMLACFKTGIRQEGVDRYIQIGLTAVVGYVFLAVKGKISQ